MVDLRSVDLLGLIGADVPLRRMAATHGGEYAGPCPFCGGGEKRDADRFRVWPAQGRFWCRRCGRCGDAIDYVRQHDGLGFGEALARLGLARGERVARRPALRTAALRAPVRAPAPLEPPSEAWQARAIALAAECADRLWSHAGARPRAWLRDVRGLSEGTILAAGLGYLAADRREPPAAWGLAEAHAPVWLPRGITIPWAAEGHLWRVNIRRPAGRPKYIGPAGGSNALYGAGGLAPGRPAVLVEGEFDALIVRQAAAGLVHSVATGSTAGARRQRWLARLALCEPVLVAFDGDAAGEDAARYWLRALPNARRWRPYYGKDANGMACLGGSVRSWVLAALTPAPPQVV